MILMVSNKQDIFQKIWDHTVSFICKVIVLSGSKWSVASSLQFSAVQRTLIVPEGLFVSTAKWYRMWCDHGGEDRHYCHVSNFNKNIKNHINIHTNKLYSDYIRFYIIIDINLCLWLCLQCMLTLLLSLFFRKSNNSPSAHKVQAGERQSCNPRLQEQAQVESTV